MLNIYWKIRSKLDERARLRFLQQVAADNAAFDTKYGTDTASFVLIENYDIPEAQRANVVNYQPVHEGVLRFIIESFAGNIAGHEFLDIGSGKGKALLIAATYPFRRVRGVELSPQLNLAALKNIEAFRQHVPMQCNDVTSQCLDARLISDFGPKTFLYLFNPFDGSLMKELVGVLEREAAQGKSLLVPYLAPRARSAFDESRAFSLLVESSRLNVYATKDISCPEATRAALERKFNAWRL